MKTSNVLATVLFGAIAAAAPLNRRALVTKTEVVVETVVVYTTIYGDDVSSAPATTTPGLFYEQPKSSKVVPTSTAVHTTSVVVAPSTSAPAPVSSAPVPSSTYVAPAPISSAVSSVVVEAVSSSAPVVEAPAPTSTYTPVAESSSIVYTPVAASTSIYTPAPVSSAVVAPASSAVVVAPAASSAAATTSGTTYSGDLTIYDNTGAFGACGTALYDTDMIVALSVDTWGASTYDVMTGAATNPWCGQKITIEYNGNQVEATIMDMCAGCSGEDIDLSLATWTKVTGLAEKTRLQGSWWKSS